MSAICICLALASCGDNSDDSTIETLSESPNIGESTSSEVPSEVSDDCTLDTHDQTVRVDQDSVVEDKKRLSLLASVQIDTEDVGKILKVRFALKDYYGDILRTVCHEAIVLTAETVYISTFTDVMEEDVSFIDVAGTVSDEREIAPLDIGFDEVVSDGRSLFYNNSDKTLDRIRVTTACFDEDDTIVDWASEELTDIKSRESLTLGSGLDLSRDASRCAASISMSR